MKKELLDESDFDVGPYIDKKALKQVQEEKKKREAKLLTKEELESAIKMLNEDGVDKFPLLTINEAAKQKISTYRKILFGFNLPLCLALPFICEFGLDMAHPKANILYVLLYTADTFFFVNLFTIYGLVRQAVFAINYLPKENKVEIQNYTKWLKPQTLSLSPSILSPAK